MSTVGAYVLALTWALLTLRRLVHRRAVAGQLVACAACLALAGLAAMAAAGAGQLAAAVPGHGLWVVALGATWHWLAGAHFGAGEPLSLRRARLVSVGAGAPVLAAAWMLGAHGGGPVAQLTRLVAGLGFSVLLIGVGLGVAATGTAAAGATRGRYRASIVLTAFVGAAAAELGLMAILGALRDPSVLARAERSALPGQAVLLALLAVAAVVPLLPRRGHALNPGEAPALERLWSWLAPNDAPIRIDDSRDAGMWLSDAVIDIRDRMVVLQRWVRPEDFDAALAVAHGHGLAVRPARAAAAAECFWSALRAESRVGARVRAARERAGLTPVQLAERADLDVDTVRDVERGAVVASAELLTEAACALGMAASELAGQPGAHAQLGRLGGGRRLEDEVSWLLAVHDALGLIVGGLVTGSPGDRARPAAPRSLVADPEVVEQCQRVIDDWLPTPRPATVAATRALIAQRRGKPIEVIALDGLPARTLWFPQADIDYILIDRNLSPFMAAVSEAHEWAHLIFEHTPIEIGGPAPRMAETLAEASSLPPALAGVFARGRCLHDSDWRTDPEEVQAEIGGRLLAMTLLHAPGAAYAAALD